MEDTWAGMDPDDVAGYLMDYLNSELSDNGEPLDDDELEDKLRHDEGGEWAGDILFNIRNAVRAKNG